MYGQSSAVISTSSTRDSTGLREQACAMGHAAGGGEEKTVVVTTVLTSSILSSFDLSITLTATLFLLKTCCGKHDERPSAAGYR